MFPFIHHTHSNIFVNVIGSYVIIEQALCVILYISQDNLQDASYVVPFPKLSSCQGWSLHGDVDSKNAVYLAQ